MISYRDVAVANGETFFTLHVLSILSEEGKELVSTSSISKCFLRRQAYRNSECACNEYGFMTSVFVSKWLPMRRIICEVTLEKTEVGLIVISEDSQMDVANCYKKIVTFQDDAQSTEKEKRMSFMRWKNSSSLLEQKYHSEEYKVRCKGYGAEGDMWLPNSSFREPVQSKDETDDSPPKKVKPPEYEYKHRHENNIE